MVKKSRKNIERKVGEGGGGGGGGGELGRKRSNFTSGWASCVMWKLGRGSHRLKHLAREFLYCFRRFHAFTVLTCYSEASYYLSFSIRYSIL